MWYDSNYTNFGKGETVDTIKGSIVGRKDDWWNTEDVQR
jgi:hypothetical protein